MSKETSTELPPHPIMLALSLLGVRWVSASKLLGVTHSALLLWRGPNPPTPAAGVRATLLLYTQQVIELARAALVSVPPHLVDAQRDTINQATALYLRQEGLWAKDLRPADWSTAHLRIGAQRAPIP